MTLVATELHNVILQPAVPPEKHKEDGLDQPGLVCQGHDTISDGVGSRRTQEIGDNGMDQPRCNTIDVG